MFHTVRNEQTTKLTWSTPHWAHVRKWIRQSRSLFSWRFWLRVSLASAVLFAALVGLAKWQFPLLQVGALWPAAAVVPAMFVYLAIMIGLHIALPKFVEVRKDRVSVNHGQTTTIIPAQDVEATRLVFFGDDRTLLRITYRQKGQRRSRNVGVKPGVDLSKLVRTLPMPPRVSDLRRSKSGGTWPTIEAVNSSWNFKNEGSEPGTSVTGA